MSLCGVEWGIASCFFAELSEELQVVYKEYFDRNGDTPDDDTDASDIAQLELDFWSLMIFDYMNKLKYFIGQITTVRESSTQWDKKKLPFFLHTLFKKWKICDVLKNMILLLHNHIIHSIIFSYK